MRLIDANKLKATRGMFIYQTEDADVIATEAYRWELIEREAPAVKAIPVRWIKKWIYDNENTDNAKKFYEMLEDWEWEQINENETV